MSEIMNQTQAIPKYASKVKNAYSGTVATLEINDADKFYNENTHLFSELGRETYLESIGIPVKFFDAQPQHLQKDLLASQKINTMNKNNKNLLVLLTGSGRIDYCKIGDPETFEDPKILFNISDVNGWIEVNNHLADGYQRYFYNPNGIRVQEEFEPGLYINIPMFNNGTFKMDAGMYRLVCQNGLSLVKSSKSLRLSSSKFNPELMPAITGGIMAGIEDIAAPHIKMLDSLKSIEIDAEHFDELLAKERTADRLSRLTIKESRKHIQAINAGAISNLPANSPESINNYYDVLNLVTFYSHNGVNSAKKRSKYESYCYEFIKEEYFEKTGLKLLQTDLKAAYRNTGLSS